MYKVAIVAQRDSIHQFWYDCAKIEINYQLSG